MPLIQLKAARRSRVANVVAVHTLCVAAWWHGLQHKLIQRIAFPLLSTQIKHSKWKPHTATCFWRTHTNSYTHIRVGDIVDTLSLQSNNKKLKIFKWNICWLFQFTSILAFLVLESFLHLNRSSVQKNRCQKWISRPKKTWHANF